MKRRSVCVTSSVRAPAHTVRRKKTHPWKQLETVTQETQRLNFQFGQWAACIADVFTLMPQAKLQPTDIEIMCDKMSRTPNMTSLCSTNL